MEDLLNVGKELLEEDMAPAEVGKDEGRRSQLGVKLHLNFEMSMPVWGSTERVVPGSSLAFSRTLQHDTSSGLRTVSLSLEVLSLEQLSELTEGFSMMVARSTESSSSIASWAS